MGATDRWCVSDTAEYVKYVSNPFSIYTFDGRGFGLRFEVLGSRYRSKIHFMREQLYRTWQPHP